MFAFDVLHLFNAAHDLLLVGGGFEVLVASFYCLLEQKNSLFVHQEVQKLLLFFSKKRAVLIFKLCHFSDLFVVVVYCMIYSCSVDDKANSILDIFKSFEASMQILNQFWKFISPGLTYVTLINNQHNFNMLIDI